MTDSETKKRAKTLRTLRKVHRITGAMLFIFFFILACSGLLLGCKKHSGGMILPKSYKGKSTNPKDWLTLDDLHNRAFKIAHEQISPDLSTELE